MNRADFIRHKELILAWAAGADVQFWNELTKKWNDAPLPSWSPNYTYRIKPDEPRVFYIPVYNGGYGWGRPRGTYSHNPKQDAECNIREWIKVVEDTSFVPDQPDT